MAAIRLRLPADAAHERFGIGRRGVRHKGDELVGPDQDELRLVILAAARGAVAHDLQRHAAGLRRAHERLDVGRSRVQREQRETAPQLLERIAPRR